MSGRAKRHHDVVLIAMAVIIAGPAKQQKKANLSQLLIVARSFFAMVGE
jgi:hypothetical protein